MFHPSYYPVYSVPNVENPLIVDDNQPVGYKWYQSCLSSDMASTGSVTVAPYYFTAQVALPPQLVSNPNMYYAHEYEPPPVSLPYFYSPKSPAPQLFSENCNKQSTSKVFDESPSRKSMIKTQVPGPIICNVSTSLSSPTSLLHGSETNYETPVLLNFDGTDPRGWILKVGIYINGSDAEKIYLAGSHFRGKAKVWYRCFYETRKGEVGWKKFLHDLLIRFDSFKLDNPGYLVNPLSLEQFSSVAEYEINFLQTKEISEFVYEFLFTEEMLVHNFVSGLKKDIRERVSLLSPMTLQSAINLAKFQVLQIEKEMLFEATEEDNEMGEDKAIVEEFSMVQANGTENFEAVKNESSEGFQSNITKDVAVCVKFGKVSDSYQSTSKRPDFADTSCPGKMNTSRVELSDCAAVDLSASKMTVIDEGGKAFDLFKTPVRQVKCSGSLSSVDVAANITGVSNGVTASNETVVELPINPNTRHAINKSSEGGSIESLISLTPRDGLRKNICNTPVKKEDCHRVEESCGILDEEFEESILQEIDALCESRPKVISGTDSTTGNLQMRSQSTMIDGGNCKIDSSSIDLMERLRGEESLHCADVQDCVQAPNTSQTSKTGCMPEAYAKYIKSLNDKQCEAACSDISIPLVIVAGPGSGKTSTMVGRVLMLLNEGISPSNILAMTFTTAAASEMRDRIGAVAGKEVAKELMVSTFHSFALQLCRSQAEKLERTPEFLIYGQGQQRRAIIEAIRLCENDKNSKDSELCKLGEESNGINSAHFFKDKAQKWLKFVTQAKASGKNSQDFRKSGDEIGAAVLQNYNNILKSCDALDYHDLISCSVKLLTDFPEVLKDCQVLWKAVVVDEFQDTSGMQYSLLRILASHNRITIVGDEDQSIFSFNGANAFGFNTFRNDFPMYKEVRLDKNYRSTRCIIEAASFLIRNNAKRSQTKRVLTDNSSGSKITIKECCNEDAQCAFIVDKILENTSDGSSTNPFGNVAVLYRRQVSGKIFQKAFRDRKIPFNIHGVAFYRKKVVRAIISMLNTTLPGCEDDSFRRVFKALLSFEKEEKKKVIEHIDKISTVRRCSFISAARDIFSAKISGTFKRNQLTQGRKVLLTLDMISKLVNREHSISAVISSVANMIPQKYLLEQRAVIDVDGGKLLNEDNDLRSVLNYLLDDVSEYLKSHITIERTDAMADEKGCVNALKGFIDFISVRERENFRSRRHENEHSVTLTTIHQSKGLEWDTVFIVKANESEIPLLHESNGTANGSALSLEEERRLLYVAMTRARKKLFILYVLMDSSWQVLQPSRFLKEIPKYLQEGEDEENSNNWQADCKEFPGETLNHVTNGIHANIESTEADMIPDQCNSIAPNEVSSDSVELIQACNGNSFLKRFSTDDRSVVSHMFHQWAKKAAFQEPKRLLDKVGFVIDERLRIRKSTHKDVLREVKSCLKTEEAFQYAEYVLQWERIPADKRAYIMKEKQEHFLKLRIENAMGSTAPTSKQIGYLRNLGCTIVPTSRLHASQLIEQYKSL